MAGELAQQDLAAEGILRHQRTEQQPHASIAIAAQGDVPSPKLTDGHADVTAPARSDSFGIEHLCLEPRIFLLLGAELVKRFIVIVNEWVFQIELPALGENEFVHGPGGVKARPAPLEHTRLKIGGPARMSNQLAKDIVAARHPEQHLV